MEGRKPHIQEIRIQARQEPVPAVAGLGDRESSSERLSRCPTETCVPVACELLPEQLVAELLHVSLRTVPNCVPHIAERQESMTDVGRQTRRAAPLDRGDLVAPGGVARHVETGERGIGRPLSAPDRR